jgi:hypothetical protein
LVWLLLATGCDFEFRLDPQDSGDAPVRVVVEDTFVQAPEPAVDLLFVVDDTASMAQEQEALGDAAAALVDALGDAGLAWQAAVVSTDMSGSDAGWLRGDPFVLTPGLPDVESLFALAFAVGVDGAAPEAGLAAAVEAVALAEAGGPNAGFRRPDAALHVVFVSDDDDASDEWLGLDPVSSFVEAMGGQDRAGLPARASAVVGPVPDGCTTANGTAQAGARYKSVVERTGGTFQSICEADFAPLLAALADVAPAYPTRFDLSQDPKDDDVGVAVDGARLTEGWTLDRTDGPAVIFDVAPAAGAEIVVTYVVEVAP